MSLVLQSPSFRSNGAIPSQHTCEGRNISPPLQWRGAPPGTASYVLIVDDPDAPNPEAPERTWVHWVLYDIPAEVAEMKEGQLPPGAKCGKNDWMRAEYGGPCPPQGRHRYFHKLYALDNFIANLLTPTKSEVLRAIEGHVLDQSTLIGTYQKSGPTR